MSGGTTGAASSALTQFADTGTIDTGQVMDSAAKGAVLGAISGGTSGQIQSNAAQKILGNSRAQTMFTSSQPGAAAGNIAGNSVNAISSVVDNITSSCKNNNRC